jgi:hypothetical protein
MTKKEVRIKITGRQRREIDVDLMTQAVIALGRELGERKPAGTKTALARSRATASTGAGS